MKRYMLRVMLPVGIVAVILVAGNRLMLSTSIEDTSPVDTSDPITLGTVSEFEEKKEETIETYMAKTQNLDQVVTAATAELTPVADAEQKKIGKLLNRVSAERTALMTIISDMHYAEKTEWNSLRTNAETQWKTFTQVVDKLEEQASENGSPSDAKEKNTSS